MLLLLADEGGLLDEGKMSSSSSTEVGSELLNKPTMEQQVATTKDQGPCDGTAR